MLKSSNGEDDYEPKMSGVDDEQYRQEQKWKQEFEDVARKRKSWEDYYNSTSNNKKLIRTY